jgi:hypothetical protein
MVLWALRGYWMAIAFQWRQEVGSAAVADAQMRRIALDGIHQLRQQIGYLELSFGLEQTDLSSGMNLTTTYVQSLLGSSGVRGQVGVEHSGGLSSSTGNEAIASEKQDDEWYGGQDLFDSKV